MPAAQTTHGLLDVPVVDISAHLDPNPTESKLDAVAEAVDRAARTVGFMQIVGHGVPDTALANFTAALDDFFGLDLAVKSAYRCPPSINRGYTPPKSESLANSLGLVSAADLFEAFNIGAEAADYPGLQLPAEEYAPNVWPDEIPGFRTALETWFAEARRVAQTMDRIFGRALGLGDDGFAEYTDHSLDVLRTINYRLPSADVELEPDQLGMGAHTDYGIVTILWADAVPGLEILGSDGGWYPTQPAPGALLVNFGDAMARLTNDQWLSTMHRVAPPMIDGVLVPRRSAAFFHDGNIDAVIAPLPACLRDGAEPLYEPVTVQEHLRRKLAGSRAGVLNEEAGREASRLGH